MTHSTRALVLALAVALLGPASAGAGVIVKLDGATQQRLGIVTAPLVAANHTASTTGFARTIDAVPLAILDADIAAARAALAASQAEASRSRTLYAADQTVSKRAMEAATAQALADNARLTLLRRRLGLEWGPSIQALSDARRGRLVADLAEGRAALIRIDSAAGVSHLRGAARIDLGASGVVQAAIMGPARLGDARLQATGLLAMVTGPQAMSLAVGAVAPAILASGPGTPGVVLPRAALLRTGGQTYVYVRKDAANFERRVVTGGISEPAGLFAGGGFRSGDQVVVKGAAQLFAAETPSQPAE